MSGSLKTALFGIIAYLHCTYMYMSGQRVFFLTFQSLSYPLTLMTFEDLTKKKVFPPKFQISLLEWLGFLSENRSIGPTGTQQEDSGVGRHVVSSWDGDRLQGKSVVLGGQPQKHDRERPVQRKQQTNHRLPRRRQVLWSCTIRGTISPTNYELISCSWDNWNCSLPNPSVSLNNTPWNEV